MLALVAAVTIATCGAARADMIDTSGMEPWENCALCHGLDGISRMAKFPRLAGQPAPYLIKQLEDFRSRRRHNDDGVMGDNAGILSPEEVPVVADYFSRQEPPEPATANGAADMARGARLFTHGREADGIPACAGCHLDKADTGRYPLITAQHAAYIAKQLQDFKSGLRTNDPEQTMRGIAARLDETDIEAVAAYAASLPRQEERAK